MIRPSPRRAGIDAQLPNFFKPGTDAISAANPEASCHTVSVPRPDASKVDRTGVCA